MNKTKSEILVERLKELYKEIEIVRRELINETNKEKLKEKQNENEFLLIPSSPHHLIPLYAHNL